MRPILAVLFLVALPAAAAAEVREPYPSDYKAIPCAAKNVCQSFPRVDFARYAGSLRKLPLRQEWVERHWDEMTTAFAPICRKIANCLGAPATSDWVFCTDFMRPEFLATANRYPEGSDDRDQWTMAALVWYIGLDNALIAGHKEAQQCAAAQKSETPRTMDAWVATTIGPDYNGNLMVYATDTETRIPVMASIEVEGQHLQPANDSPNGRAMTYYKFPWPLTYNFTKDANGRREIAIPQLVLTAPGYETVRLPMPLAVPKLVVELQPPASQWKGGTNVVTVIAKDAETGKPVEMRVFAGDEILGSTNKPLTLELPRGKKRPEIWITSLFNRYSDVVVAKAQ